MSIQWVTNELESMASVTLLPVIGRELRAEARRPFTHSLRVLGAGALILVATWVFFTDYVAAVNLARRMARHGLAFRGVAPGQNPNGDLGMILFGDLHATLFITLWVLVPLLTADCINREKREGTLGLLFLTPLTSTGIVVGKSVAQGLRALTLYLTMLPVLVLPLMLGGITARDGLMAALLDLGIVMLALAAGLLASAWTRDWLKSVAVAQMLSALFALAFMTAQQWSLRQAISTGMAASATATANGIGNRSGNGSLGYTGVSLAWDGILGRSFFVDGPGFLSHLSSLFALATNYPTDRPHVWTAGTGIMVSHGSTSWGEIWSTFPPSVHRAWFGYNGLLVLGCFGVLLVSAFGAGQSIERGWRERPTSLQRERLQARFAQPLLGRFLLRRRLKLALDRNPIGWLHQHSLSARLTKWGWCGFIVIIEVLGASNWRDAWDAQAWIAMLLLLGLTFSAASSFRQERETGALELLLVTPLRAQQIIRGRVRGIRLQYLPSMATLLLALFCLLHAHWLNGLFAARPWDEQFVAWLYVLVSVATSYLTLPTIGLYFSLRSIHPLASWLWSCAVGLLVPGLLLGSFDWGLNLLSSLGFEPGPQWTENGPRLVPLIAAVMWQWLAALVAGALLHRAFTRREIPVSRPG